MYKSINEAWEKTGIARSQIARCANGIYETARVEDGVTKTWSGKLFYKKEIIYLSLSFIRGQLINFGEQVLKRIYPAIIFSDKANNFNIFITHGCQGQGLHDAGDELASWGVYVKYNWWLEIFPKKLKSEKELVEKMYAIEKDLEKHEEMLYKWALDQKDEAGKKKYNILVAGHTHIPVFNYIPDDSLYDVVAQDIKSGKYIFFNDIFEKEQTARTGEGLETADRFKLPASLQERMLQKLEAKKNMVKGAKKLEETAPLDPFYFNTGCGFNSKITCIEISAGKIYLRLLGFDKNGKIDFDSYVDKGDLKVYAE